jgi:hypothetical protein
MPVAEHHSQQRLASPLAGDKLEARCGDVSRLIITCSDVPLRKR